MRLEPLSERHLPGMEELVADPDVLRFTRVPDPPPPGFARTWLEGYERGRETGTRIGFAAVDDDGAFLGLALAPDVDAEAREVELGYIVAASARGRGVASAIVGRLTRWAFDDLGALRLVLLIDSENAGSQKVAQRSGYVLEGVLRSVHLKQDRRIDQAVWSRLPAD